MRKARYKDIKMELWLRERDSGEIRWITKDGKELPIKDMTTNHLRNVMEMIERVDDMNAAVDDEWFYKY